MVNPPVSRIESETIRERSSHWGWWKLSCSLNFSANLKGEDNEKYWMYLMDVIRMFLFLALGPSVSSLELAGLSNYFASLGSDARVPVLISVDEPPVDLKHLTIFWHFLNKEILSYNKTLKTNSSRYFLNIEELIIGIGILTISNVQISDGGRYKCSVIYGSEKKEKEASLDIRSPPQVTITDKMVVLNAESVLRCSVTGFFPPDIDIKWFRNEEKLVDNIILGDTWRNQDRTYSVNSTVTITPTEEDRERIFSCRVQHKYLQEPLQEDFHLVYEDRSSAGIIIIFSLIPVILITIIAGVVWRMEKSREKAPFIVRDIVGPLTLMDGEKATLSCTVDNAPEDLRVTGLIRSSGQEKEIKAYQTRGHSEEKEESLLDTSYVIRSQVVENYTWTPVVEEIQTPRLLHGSPAVLQCNISGYFPDTVTVKWMRRDGDKLHEETDDNQRITSRRAADNTYSRTASLTITPDLRTHQGAEYICLVEHPSLERPIERSSGRLRVYGKPQILLPIQITKADSSRVQFSLNLQKFYPKDIKISWSWEDKSDKYPLSPGEPMSTWDNDVTYQITSFVWVPDQAFTDEPMKLIVEWKHESMETSETRSLSVRDLQKKPHVGSISVPQLEDGKSAKLTFHISGYFPKFQSVDWLMKRDGNETDLSKNSSNVSENYKVSNKEPIQTDNTYSFHGSVTFTPTIRSHQGSEIICRMKHPTEERPIERSTGPLHIGERHQTLKVLSPGVRKESSVHDTTQNHRAQNMKHSMNQSMDNGEAENVTAKTGGRRKNK
ncbi:uncharacterized protein [Phyllobates terribilis]|uniref:uncharacterized protein n=1 Tax=Phyllobates terribilis TaxID=111132 RepID=UPI003CCB042B